MKLGRFVNGKRVVAAAFVLVLLCGAFVRIRGVYRDMPYGFHPDEATVLAIMADTVARGTALPPEASAYGHLNFYLFVPLLAAADLLHHADLSDGILARKYGRMLAETCAILSIWIIFAVGRKAYGDWAGVMAAALFAFCPLLIQHARSYTPDPSLVLTLLLSVLACLRLMEKPSFGRYVAAGFAVGLALGVKVNAVFLLPVVFAAHIAVVRTRGLDWPRPVGLVRTLFHPFHLRLVLVGVIVLAIFVAFNPTLPKDPAGFFLADESIWSLAYNVKIVNGKLPQLWTLQFQGTRPYLFYITNLFFWGMGPLLEAAGIAGLLYLLFVRRTWTDVILAIYPVLYFASSARLFSKFIRYTVPAAPFLILFAAGLLMELWRRRGTGVLRQTLTWSLIVLVIGSTVLYGIAFAGIYGRKDVRILAAEWFFANVPMGHNVLVEPGADFYGPPLWGRHGDRPQALYDKIVLPLEGIFRRSSFVQGTRAAAPGAPLTEKEIDGILRTAVDKADEIIVCSVSSFSFRGSPEFPGVSGLYRDLFDGKLGFSLAAKFSDSPRLFGIRIPTERAEPSFKLFDHPDILVFSRKPLSP